MVRTFFNNLSYKKRNENDLSDVTWAMCETSEKFKELFLKFFFPNDDFSNLIAFEREKSKGSSRVDFYIEILNEVGNQEIYLVEVKKGDESHHFDYIKQYKTQGRNFGYISNYHITNSYIEQKCREYNIEYINEVKYIKFKTWREFYDNVKSTLFKIENEEEKQLWEGFLKYLESVCSIIKITKKMDLKGMYSVYSFEIKLENLLKAGFKNNDFEINHYTGRDSKDEKSLGITGSYFEIDYRGKIEKTWGWVGVYYNTENPIVCLCFDNRENWGKPVYDKLFNNIDKAKNNTNDDTLIDKIYKSSDNKKVWFDMKNTDFQNAETPEKQMEILKNFIDEVVTIPLTL